MKPSFKRKARAAISIFLIIVLFSTVLLGGLFIDAARVSLAKRYVQSTLDSSTRSALSYYDVHLASEYGLFAVDKAKAEEACKRYFINNLKLNQSNSFNMLRMNVKDDGVSVTVSEPLSEKGGSNYQTLIDAMSEYSKYRTVVNTAYGVVKKLECLFGPGGTASEVMDAADDGQKALQKMKDDVTESSNEARDSLSSGVGDAAKKAKKHVQDELKDTLPGDDIDLGFDEIDDNINNARDKSKDIDSSIDKYHQESSDAYRKADEAQNQSTSAEVVDPETGNTTKVDGDFKSEEYSSSENPEDKAKKEKASVDGLIDETQARSNASKSEIESKVKQIQSLNQQIAELKSANSNADISIPQAEEDLKELKERKKNEDKHLYDLDDIYDLEVHELQQKCIDAKDSGDKDVLEDAMKEMEDKLKELGYEPKNIHDDEIESLENSIDSAKEQVKANEKEIKELEKQVEKLSDEIGTSYDSIEADDSSAESLDISEDVSDEDKEKADSDFKQLIDKCNEMIDHMLEEAQKVASDVTVGTDDSGDNINFFQDIGLGFLGQIKDKIKNLISLFTGFESLGDATLLTDYVFDNYTFLTSQTERSNRHFKVAEIEYILNGGDPDHPEWGGDGQMSCVFSTLLDIAMLRLVINWVDCMCTTHSPEIISRILISLGRALVLTGKDMINLVFIPAGGDSAEIGLCPSFDRVKLTYSDHLRLAMILQAITPSGRSDMMKRIVTMMDDTYKVHSDWGDFRQLNTSIKADVTVEVDLIMLTLPMFEAILPPDNKILQDGKFLVHQTASLTY